MHRLILILFLFIVFTLVSSAQSVKGKYFVQFKDKDHSPFVLSNPEQFLSAKSIERRLKQNIPINTDDLPVSSFYIDSIKKMGFKIRTRSKWFNAVTLEVSDSVLFNKLSLLSFVDNFQITKPENTLKGIEKKDCISLQYFGSSILSDNEYGSAYNQIALNNGQWLHKAGYTGAGMLIAIIDAGFDAVNTLSAFAPIFESSRLIATKDFVDGDEYLYDAHFHGRNVFSMIGGFMYNTYMGTAPDASFVLLRSEDVDSEFLIEEDNWIAAAEFADSIGADLINTSLGYSKFNDSMQNHSYPDMNGHVARISKAASMAASKGIIVVVAAGNEGDDTWRYITAPADADSILTVGAVTDKRERAVFSSIGYSSDGRVKPDIMAMGFGNAFQDANGQTGYGDGTSYASPVICGLAACLWQAFPTQSAQNIIGAIRQSANQFNSPNSFYGYGIPDFEKAYNIFSTSLISSPVVVAPNPFTSYIGVYVSDIYSGNAYLSLTNTMGYKIWEKRIVLLQNTQYIFSDSEIANATAGLYIFKISNMENEKVVRIIKGF